LVVSVCIITKNEASNLKTCLDSVCDIADEIIILDAFSTDATVEIAQQYTSNIFQREWTDDFSHARNFTLEKATGDWILVIDADEVFRFTKNFKATLQSATASAFAIIRKEIYRQAHDRKRVQYPVSIIRLFKRTTNARFRYPIHERLDDFFQENNLDVSIQQECYLEHHISIDFDAVNTKQEKYLQCIVNFLATHPQDEWLTYQRIKTLQYFKRHDQALQVITQFQPKTLKIKVATVCIESQIYSAQGNFEKAIQVLKRLPKFSKHTIVMLLLGDLYFSQKKYVTALKYYIQLKTTAKSIRFPEAMYISTYCEKTDKVYKIASVLYSLKLYVACLLYLDAHAKYLQADSLLLYAFIFLKKGDKAKALTYIQKARSKDHLWKKLLELEALCKSSETQ
jgi:glycosyltransferase involved in cell wall biosynthesis